jgi:hypothetical protein
LLFIISIFAASAARAAPNGLTSVFSSGFENGFNSWTSTSGGVSVVSSPVYSGSYAMKCSDSWGSLATVSIGTQSEAYTEAEFNFDRNFAGSQTLIAYFNGNGNPSVLMGIFVQSGKVFVFVEDKLPSYSYSQYQLTGVTPGTWYKFALDASATSATLYVNDQKLGGISQANIPATATVKIGTFWGDGSYTGNLYIDNAQIYGSYGGNPIPTQTPTSTPTPTPTPTPTSTPTSTSVFSSGFENGFNSWTSTSGGVSVVSSPVYSGSYAMKCSDSWGSLATVSIGTQSEAYTEAEFNFDRNFAGSQTLIAYFNGNGNPSVLMGIFVQSGKVFVFVEDKLPSYSYSQYQLTGVTPGTWYKFALDASATSATLYVNDQKLGGISQANIPATATVKIGTFWGDGSYTGNLYIDNVQIGSSSGSTSTSNPTPTPSASPTSTPTPTPTPTSAPTFSGGSLPLSCLGDDYLVWSNWNGDPNYWASQIHWFTQFHCNTARLGFSFADDTGSDKDSTYTYAKLNTVLTYLSSVGVKPIICDFGGFGSYFYGSTAWVNDWKNLASSFAGDSRIKAFEFANEPYSYYLAPNANTLSTFNSVCASLIDQIRAIDPSRTIMYPIEVGVMTDSASVVYNDLVANGIPAKGNILYDITHPYYFEKCPSFDPVNDPIADADCLWNYYVLPQISYFGASNVWCGETFPWSDPSTGGTHTYALQQQFEIAMINHFVSVGMGFQMWCFFSSANQQSYINALTNSNYYTLIHS